MKKLSLYPKKNPSQSTFILSFTPVCGAEFAVYSPWGAVDPEAPHCDLGVLKIDAVREQRLDVLVVLRLQLGGGGEVVEVLLDQVGHKLLVKGQLVVPSDDYLDVVGQGTLHGTREGSKE